MAQQDSNFVVVFDTETTGLKPAVNNIVQLASVMGFEGGRVEFEFDVLVNPGHPIPPNLTEIHGINDAMVADAPSPREVVQEWWADIHAAADGAPITLVAHNPKFDLGFLSKSLNFPMSMQVVDTVDMARRLWPSMPNHKLGTVHEQLGIPQRAGSAHNALVDCYMCWDILNAGLAQLGMSITELFTWQGRKNYLTVNNLGSYMAARAAS